MPNSTQQPPQGPGSRAPRAVKGSRLRYRAVALLTAGAAASAALTGVAAASDGGHEQPEAFSSRTVATQLAKETHGQAAALRAAAEAAEQDKSQAKDAKDAQSAREKAAKHWVSPISDDYELTASFGNSGDRWAHKHSGQDFAVPVGTPVHAVHGGTVVKAGPNGAGDGPAYGNAVVIKHADGTYTQYAHLSRIDVTVGQQVSTDQRIARSGNTGNTSGPHLHFEVRTTPNYGSAVNPMAFLHEKGVDD
ncbi:M23 family metallopeptidase [Streptomyces hoynatensis]|uniref:M23 family metallopeptidase n=1 Tax=Streptomyces hoynatensis TaxID=1141874 RepID=A0A3A9Z310_9ACTN|nr:M23 family metallopeptidase [Streptomyces hoynatensis]